MDATQSPRRRGADDDGGRKVPAAPGVEDAVRRARHVEGDPGAWLRRAHLGPVPPVAAEVWVLDPELEHVVLVRHRDRGWVPPGGAALPGEHPRDAARRELREETGLDLPVGPDPEVVCTRSYSHRWPETLAVTYAVTAPRVPLVPEPGQPAAWVPVWQDRPSRFPEDMRRLRRRVTELGQPDP